VGGAVNARLAVTTELERPALDVIPVLNGGRGNKLNDFNALTKATNLRGGASMLFEIGSEWLCLVTTLICKVVRRRRFATRRED
jgi:hypothetical protein